MLFDKQVELEPNNYPWSYDFIDKIWAGFWTPNEFDFKSDYAQFKKEMSEPEKQMVVKALSAIAQVEIDVKRFWGKIGDLFPQPSIAEVGYVMASIEVTHSRAYKKLLDKLFMKRVFKENLQQPELKGRVEYLRKHLNKFSENDKKQIIYSLILFTLFTENVSLFSQFYIILYLKHFKNILKDTGQQIAYTRNEESLHAQLGIKLITTLQQEYPDLFDSDLNDTIIKAVDAAVESEDHIIDWMLGDFNEELLNPAILKTFIRSRINESLVQINIDYQLPTDPVLEDKTEWFNEELIGENKVDFFASKPVNYVKSTKAFDAEDWFN